ncbi:MAG: METTL5 family protein [Candidatus Bathyarchaeia archaeon]
MKALILHPRQVLIRKRDLAIKLQQVSPHPDPKVALEQYTIPADLAANILFEACYIYDDIENKSVIDLGTGTGRLALGASMLGAEYVVGVDLDMPSLGVAIRHAKQLALRPDWVHCDIRSLRGRVDTVLMNPPFGTKQPHADIHFLEVALTLGTTVYSIHKSSTRRYLIRWLQGRADLTERILSARMEILHQFPFHRKQKHQVEVDVFRIHPS